jgi:hypothetical protein
MRLAVGRLTGATAKVIPQSKLSHRVTMLRRMQSPVMIVLNPLLIVREFREASFEILKFPHLVGGVRRLCQCGILGRLGAILLEGEH